MRLRLLDRWKLWRWRTAGLVVTEQACRRCGYAVRGLETTTCPECGANRYHIGTIGPLRPLVQRWQAFVVLWWFAVIVFAIAADPLLMNCLPRMLGYREEYVLTPHSGLYGPLPFQRVGQSFGWPGLGPFPKSPYSASTPDGFTMINAFGAQFATAIYVDLQSGHGSCQATLVSTPIRPPGYGRFDAEFVLSWLRGLRAQGVRLPPPLNPRNDDPDLRAEAAELAQLARARTFDPNVHQSLQHFDVTVKQIHFAAEPHPEAALVTRLLAWGIPGVIGTRIILKRLRRRAHPS
jgi:hypothetical protein